MDISENIAKGLAKLHVFASHLGSEVEKQTFPTSLLTEAVHLLALGVSSSISLAEAPGIRFLTPYVDNKQKSYIIEIIMTPPPLGQLNFHIPITPLFLFAIMLLVLIGWVIFTLVIRYHWKNYGTGKLEVFTMNFFYLVGSAVLIALMGILALLYLSSAT